ncbi:5-(carboxyamino)imidazole ribonucleotide synthase [Agrobacterium rosae]|uniref:N5-carboxyaminoimidazole ribonucleotide synthase n=1 Tax=Agrobacterium rosae TaxID=1972867 RepID=A0AAE5VR57_9HYPH|nr:5-(carboxyamino)imidazole ribonucleotide synthase [Agrobacterium rosae]KAA3513069.1 5-(carboxyamino)imidazole ribonucleotide synthase [Agrobacterium rosae]KAA3521441.1 5-(carboxyamino)imidazole ribonucleotide synthase [Agrobacterium rosae]MCM2432699.1 5-(carboxyamino)imidazole ribonucleotide synthase [Agrobacterium rosae]MDX8328230.1 5-(carboxyamino)imidazole ribonucleotide synthase [Agrobacterium rosae]MQB48348.1 5-(carboxyamino)imidazole ribonucleotide synthase [Agrobacterium rosae]
MTLAVTGKSGTIGIIGGGQLARMLAMAAARLNFRTIVLEPQADCPAAQVCNRQIVAAYDDEKALAELANVCDVVTYEFENVPVVAAQTLAASVPVYPPAKALSASQDRLTEKRFLNDCGIPTADFRQVDDQASLEAALSDFGGKGVLKTRRMGYDGKGQRVFKGGEDLAGAFDALGGVALILESFVPFEREVSIIAARFQDGTVTCYDPAENVHLSGILHTSTVPSQLSEAATTVAMQSAEKLLAALDYIGVVGIEFFVLPDGSLVANEMAPRVHNTGHWTEAACVVSQFEQHIRAVAGLAPGSTQRHSDCVMTNLIGDDINAVPQWLAKKDCLVHLYGKTEARAGRKMGHVTELMNPGKPSLSRQNMA